MKDPKDRSPDGAIEIRDGLDPSVARYRGLGTRTNLIPGLTPGAIVFRHLRWLVDSSFPVDD